MYLEKRKENTKTKYYLNHSYREGSKVHKVSKYLGTDLSKEKLTERKQIAEKLILEEVYKFQLQTDLLAIEFSKRELDEIKKLQKNISINIEHFSEDKWKQFSKLFTYNTNAIEGSTLNLKDVKSILEKDLWPDKSKEDIAEALGVDAAITYIRRTKEPFSIDLIKKIHYTVFRNSKAFAGKFRKKGEDVVIMDSNGRIVHEGAPYSRVVSLLNILVKWYEKHKKKYPGILLAAMVHNQFETIHPFADGNGRVGRILLNFILLQHKLPPVNIRLVRRKRYYKALQSYDYQKDIMPMIELILKEIGS